MKKLRKAVLPLIITLLLLLTLEAAVRVLRPGINFQGLESKLLRRGPSVPGKHAFVPNSEGVCFGKRVLIDEAGCRKLDGPETYAATWLILGDSVAFGVGVETPDTYAQLLQNEFPSVKVRNTSVPGYSLKDYRDVLNHHLAAAESATGGDRIENVLLFFCLNDVDMGGQAWQPNQARTRTEGVLSFLRRNSKLYLFVKSVAADRSKSFFTYDYQLYEKGGPRLAETLNLFGEMADALRRRNVNLLVVLQPYEYQVRTREPAHLLPQRTVAAFLEAKGISYLDAYEDFVRAGADSDEYYLYADHAHFSERGHRVVFDAVMRRLGGRAAAPTFPAR